MKKAFLLNSEISAVVADMGHSEMMAIGDCGLPVPEDTTKIDFALKRGTPELTETLQTVLTEMEIEKVILATEIRQNAPQVHKEILEIVHGADVEYIPHETFKKLLSSTKAVIRTGECTPYANIILVSGIAF